MNFAAFEASFLARLMAPTQVLAGACDGSFVQLRGPPAGLESTATACRQPGLWPILIGEPRSRQTLLCSPVMLDDSPRVAPESPGDFDDPTRMGELLTLRRLALAEGAKIEIEYAGGLVADVVNRTEGLALGVAGTVQAVRQHYEGRTCIVVTVNEYPGADLGALGQPGHQFFFRPEDVEPITQP